MTLKEGSFKGKTLAILTGGGDTQALNASMEAVRNRAVGLGYHVVGIRRGWHGLLGEGDLVDMSFAPINPLYGGTVLRSSRTNPFAPGNEKRKEEVLKNISDYGIDVMVVIGGDDTLGAARKLYQEEGIPVIAFPKTIDNDLRTRTIHKYNSGNHEVSLCPGFPTAAQSIIDYAHRIKTYAQSHERVLVLEVMGRNTGWLTGAAALAGADFALIPEVPVTKEKKISFIQKIADAYHASEHGYLLVAVAEGTQWYDPHYDRPVYIHASSERDEFGHPAFGGVSGVVAADIKKETGLPAKGVVTGFYARSGNCGDFDRKFTRVLADKVEDLLLREEYGKMPVLSEISEEARLEVQNTKAVDLSEIGNYPLPQFYYNQEAFQFNDSYIDFLEAIAEKKEAQVFDYPYQKVYKNRHS
ncbi:MAG: 6-phosphofructokinase [Bacteroidales bacterium]|nr:6-phosphofructokinase [Bacteroidales bacterium]MCF8333116.1 6-phosphofructokinase [Bacteroidales bacterium]